MAVNELCGFSLLFVLAWFEQRVVAFCDVHANVEQLFQVCQGSLDCHCQMDFHQVLHGGVS